MKSNTVDITDVYAEWDDRRQAFCVFLVRTIAPRMGDDDTGDEVYDDNTSPLRPFFRCIGSNPDPVEARLAWDVMIHCPKDTAHCLAQDEVMCFPKETMAKRVAKRVTKSLAAYRKGEPLLEGESAQMAYLMAGGKARIGFSIENLRGKIAGV